MKIKRFRTFCIIPAIFNFYSSRYSYSYFSLLLLLLLLLLLFITPFIHILKLVF